MFNLKSGRMNLGRFLKSQIQVVVDEVKSTLPDDISFDFRKHVLPLFFPFLAWKDELKQPATLRADFMAGFIGAIIGLPQSIAFAMIAGLPPIYGFYTAMIVPIVAGLFSSSRYTVSGPAAPTSLVVYATVSKLALVGTPDYIGKVLMLTFMVGVIQLGLGFGRMGRYVSFVSNAVVVSFMTGAAVLLITNQMKSALGIDIPSRTAFLETWEQILRHITEINWSVFAVTVFTLVMTVLFRKYIPRLPHLLMGLACGTALAWLLGGPAANIPFVMEIPRSLPALSLPGFSAGDFHRLLSSAFAVALFGLIQTVAVGRAIAVQSGQPIDSNQEFIGQGLSNLVGSFFSCYAGAGSITRSGLNYLSGAKTPMSAIFASLLLMLIVLLFAPFTRYLPVPALSALILVIGWGLIDFKHISEIRKASKQDKLILGVTFFTTLFAELEFAVFVGILLSLFFFLRRTSAPNIAVMAPDENNHFVNIIRKEVPQCPQLKIIRIDGNLYFGAIDHVATILRDMRKEPEKHLLILANGVNHVDLDGAEWLAREAALWRKKGGGLYIVRLKTVAQDVMESGGFMDKIGQENFFLSKTEALAYIYEKLDRDICRSCPYRVFFECQSDPELPVLKQEESSFH